jgi:hypothetical protein
MKPSIHLLYGIIIGMLLFACTGSDSTNENTSNNSGDSTSNSIKPSKQANSTSASSVTPTPSKQANSASSVTPTASPTPKQVEIYFADWDEHVSSKYATSPASKDATSPIYKFLDWKTDNEKDSKTTIKEKYAEGWKLSQIVKTNASATTWQMMLVFEKG